MSPNNARIGTSCLYLDFADYGYRHGNGYLAWTPTWDMELHSGRGCGISLYLDADAPEICLDYVSRLVGSAPGRLAARNNCRAFWVRSALDVHTQTGL